MRGGNAREVAAAMDQAEGDRICRMVHDLVAELARQAKNRTVHPVPGREPTGVTVDPEFQHYVEQRQTRRKAS